ncbi:MAG: hypothetical protein ACM3TN_23185 [Alphaproteobacteria bacterium]
MKTKLIALASAAMIALGVVATPNQAEARWRGHGYGGWWVPGAIVGGLALGAAIASRPYYGYGYAYGPRPYYRGYAYEGPYAYDYGGVSPYDYGYNDPYYYQRYRYYAPYKHWTEF